MQGLYFNSVKASIDTVSLAENIYESISISEASIVYLFGST
jgi:hypothetical protein